MQKDLKEQLARCIELMQKDVAEFEAKYQGRFAEQPHVGLGNRKTRCVNEATLPIITCHPSCLEKCAGNCPYQKSLARFLDRKHEIVRALRAQGLDAKAANKRAERLAGTPGIEVVVEHTARQYW